MLQNILKRRGLYSLYSTQSLNNLEFNIKSSGLSTAFYNLINSDLFNFTFLSSFVKEFFKQLPKNLEQKTNRKFFILLKVKFVNGNYSSLHSGVVVSLQTLKNYLEYLEDCLSEWSNDYQDEIVNGIEINFFLIPENRESYYSEKWIEIIKQPIKLRTIKSRKFSYYSIPMNRDYLNWGKVLLNTPNLIIIQFKSNVFKIYDSNEGILANKIELFKNEELVLSFIDMKDRIETSLVENIFIRDILNQDNSIEVSYYIDELTSKVVLKTKTLTNTKYLEPLKSEGLIENKIITIDIETILKDGSHIPYLFSMFDGKVTKSWFTNSPQELFDNLLKSKYRGYQIYAHNLSRFDIVFLFKYISSLKSKFDINIIKKDNDIIGIKIGNRSKNITITFKDSFLLLPSSLSNLSKTFNSELNLQKGIEPVLIPGLNTDPISKSFEQLDYTHYSKQVELIKNNSMLDFNEWKSKVQHYCELDCISLYHILSKFSNLVFSKWGINISNFPTASSLSFAIFRLNYLKENTIPLTKGKVFNFIKDSFTGGSTEMYIPSGENLYYYDVNSLYPSIMKNNLFPIGEIMQFEGDITILNNIYWIADCDVNTKNDLYAPYIQLHHKTNNGLRTISPNGNFNMKINSPEYFNGLKDYNIQIKNGYFFKQENIFNKFVTDLYSLRLSYNKGDPMNLICKLIMNSLYGRFAMKPLIESHLFTNRSEFNNICEKFEVTDLIFSLIKQIGIFLFYMWDWLTLIILTFSIIISFLIIFEFNDFLSLLAKIFPLVYSSSLFLASNLLNVEIHQTWSEWLTTNLTDFYYNLKAIYLNWLNFIFWPCYYIFYPTYWSIKLVFNMIYFPINFISESWSIIKNICTSLVILSISYLGFKLYILWDSIFQSANIIFQGTIGLFPGLPFAAYFSIAAMIEILIFPLIDFANLLTANQDNLILTIYNYIPSERDLLNLIINNLTFTNDLLENIAIPQLFDLTSFESKWLTVPARIFTLPLMSIFKTSTFISNTLISWLTPWL